MASFVDKLRMNNLYPTVPIKSGGERDIFNRFMSEVVPRMEQNRLPEIGRQAMAPPPVKDGDWDPNVSKPMDVRYQPSIGDTGRELAFSQKVHGQDMNPNAGYRQGQLALRQQEIDQRGMRDQSNAELATGRLANSQRQTAINDFRSKNPGMKILAPKGGRLQGVNPITGQVLADFGDTGTMSDEERIGLEQSGRMELEGEQGKQSRETEATRQGGRESLAEIQARHAKELEGLKSSTKPIGSTRVETVRDAQGNITGARTTKTEDNLPPKSTTVQMYGPQGQGPFPVPANRVDQAKKDGMSASKPVGK